MYHITFSGGSPIYQTGLATYLGEFFPGSRVHPQQDTTETAAAVDLQLIVVGVQPRWKKLQSLLQRATGGRKLMVGGQLSLRLIKQLLAGGLDGYLLQSAPPERFRQAVDEVCAGRGYIDPELKADWLRRELGEYRLTPIDPLTKRERQVLRLIVLEHTTEEIAGMLFISRCTVETHRAHILSKLGVRNTAGIVREAMRRNLCAV
ncbi:response regulator transcription factor [Neolewinella litorea]|nr:response regulator transcription factor [Neolewinella litorea]